MYKTAKRLITVKKEVETMKASLILAAIQFKNNNPSASLNLEVCNFKRFKELANDATVCVRRVESSKSLKVFYYA